MAKPKGILLVTLLLLVIAGGSIYFTPSSETASPLRVKLAVSTTPLSSPFYIALKNGYFADEGLDAELLDIAGGKRCFQALIDGDADLATTSDSVIMFNSFSRDDFAILSSFVASDNDIKLMTLTNSGIRQPQQLEGKRIGVVKGTASEFFLSTYLLIFGISINEVELVSLHPDQMPEALHTDKVDVISVWEPFAYKAAHKGPQPTYTLPSKGLYNLSFNLVTLKPHITDHQQTHVRLLKALKRATLFIANHPQEAQEIVVAHLNLDPAFIHATWNDYIFKLSLSNSLISTLENEASWAIENGVVSSTQHPNFRKLIDASALSAADPGATLIR